MTDEVLPRRNLGLAENWGRSVEGRMGALATKLGVEIQSLAGLGRYAASSVEEFARNAQRIEEALRALPIYFSQAVSDPSPSITTSWQTILTTSIEVPVDKPNLEILAVARAHTPYPGGGSSARFSWPFSLGLVTSEYGPRDTGFHEGIDFAGGAASAGSPIPAAGDGVVAVAATGHPGWGNYVRLEHNVGGTMMATLYAHMVSAPIVTAGNTVTRGQTLGYVGNTGNSFGAHLHFETWTSTIFGSHADPRWFMAMFGEETVASSAPLMRLTIDGIGSIQFSGMLSSATPPDLTFTPVYGRSFRPTGTTVLVKLQAISGAAITANTTTLSVTGSFHV